MDNSDAMPMPSAEGDSWFMDASERSRAANDRIARNAEALAFVSAVPFICECNDDSCQEPMPLTLDAYAEARAGSAEFLTLPGHRLTSGRVVRKSEQVWVQIPDSGAA